MKFKNILMALGLGSMLMTSCTLDEEEIGRAHV